MIILTETEYGCNEDRYECDPNPEHDAVLATSLIALMVWGFLGVLGLRFHCQWFDS